VEIVAELVRRPSVLGHEAEAQAYVAEHLRGSGMDTEIWDLDDAIKQLPNAGDSGVPFAGRPNVAGARRGAGGGRSLILNGHIDVVSPEPVADWTHDPWGAEIVGGRMYGRGACDMKSGIALQLFLARLIHDLDIPLAGDLIVQSVIEEECTGNGALAASRRDAALVTEATGGGFPYAHMGLIWFHVTVPGRAAHAGNAPDGVNAIVKMYPVIHALLDFERRLNETIHPAYANVAHPVNLVIGVIRGGDWPSMVPGACEIHCRLSFFPGVTVPEIRAQLEEAIRAGAAQDDWLRAHPPTVTYDGFQTSGIVAPLDTPFVASLRSWKEQVTGKELRPVAIAALTDMRYFAFAGMPAAVYGAAGGNAHAADEWLDLTSLVPTAKVIGGLLLDWCGVADDTGSA
jgi:acetylornithine deacetylase